MVHCNKLFGSFATRSCVQGCYKVDTRLLQGCYKVDTRLLQGCYKVDTRLLQGCYKVVTRLLQGCVVPSKVVIVWYLTT